MASVIFPASMPYDSVTVIDQSQYSDIQPIAPIDTVPSGPIMYCPFVSPRGYGKDKKLVYLDKARLAKYGTPNFDKYGFSLYLANRFVDGGGTVLGYRVMPEDASYANKLVYLKVENSKTETEVTSLDNMTYNETTKKFSFTPSSDTTTVFFNDSTNPLHSATVESITNGNTPLMNGDNIFLQVSFETDGGLTDTCTIYSKNVDVNVSYYSHNGLLSEHPSDGFETEITLPYVIGPSTGISKINKIALVTTTGSYQDSSVLFSSVTTLENNVSAIPKIANFSVANSTITKVNSDSYIKEGSGSTSLASLIDAITNSGETGVNAAHIITSYDSTVDPFLSEDPYYFPLFVIRSNSLGEFANCFKMALSRDNIMNETVKDGFFYKFTDSENNAAVDNPMSFSLFDYIYSKSSMYIDDVFSDYASQTEVITFIGIDGNSIIYTFAQYLSGDSYSVDVAKTWDLIFGSNIPEDVGVTYPRKDATEIVSDDKYILIPGIEYQFAGGSDNGDSQLTGYKFENSATNPIDMCLAEGYTSIALDVNNNNVSTTNGIGELADQYRYPFEYIYAPTFNALVVDKIHSLCDKDIRNITHARYFTPKFNTYDEARTWKDANFTEITTYQEIIECEYYLIRDPYTYKNMYVPGVYFHAFYEPQHWLNARSTPLAGRNYMITGFKTGSVVPASANPYEYIANHNDGLNTVIEDGNGYAVPYEQITAQQGNKVTSALSEINNVYILDNMIRIALQIAQNYRWSLNVEPTAYGEAVQNAIADNLAGCYKSLEVISTQDTVNGAGRNRIYCRLNVVFNSILKGVTYEFYILLDQ